MFNMFWHVNDVASTCSFGEKKKKPQKKHLLCVLLPCKANVCCFSQVPTYQNMVTVEQLIFFLVTLQNSETSDL